MRLDASPVRLLFQPSFFHPETWNGIDEHLLMLCNHLDRERFHPLVLTHQSDGPQTKLLAERARIQAVEVQWAPWASARTRLHVLREVYSQERVRLLHLHTPVAGGQAVAAAAARLAGLAATVITYHQIQPSLLPSRTRLINRLAQRTLIKDAIAVSRDVRWSLMAKAGLRERDIRVIHNGVDPTPLLDRVPALGPREPGQVRIAYFGRLSTEKGVDRLLEARARLDRLAVPVRVLIVGDGPDRRRLEAQAALLGIAEDVDFLGFRSDARQLMAEVDLVVHVPIYEGFGLVVLEAMAAARPVIVNDAPGGMSEVVTHGDTGVRVPTGSAEDLANAIAALVTNADERQRLGYNGRRRCEQMFSAKGMAAKTAAVYEGVLLRH